MADEVNRSVESATVLGETAPPHALVNPRYALPPNPQPHLVVLSPGDGLHFASPGDTVSMHYEGSLLSSGAVFDSSFGKAPFS